MDNELNNRPPYSYMVTLLPSLIEELNWIQFFPEAIETSRIKDYFSKDSIEPCFNYLSTWKNYNIAQLYLETCQAEWENVESDFSSSIFSIIPLEIREYIEITVFG